jgi:hypothetical protein
MRTKLIKIIARKSWLIFLWVLSVTMTLLMAAQFTLLSTVAWLGTPAGQKTLRDIIPVETDGSTFTLETDGASYSLPTPFVLDQININGGEKLGLDTSDIKLKLDTKNISEQRLGLEFSLLMVDKPIDFKVQLSYAQDVIKLESLSIRAPDVRVDGSGSFNIESSILNASFSGNIDSLQKYPELVDIEHNIEPISFNVVLSQKADQELFASFDASSQKYSNKSINFVARDIKVKGTYAGEVVNISSLSALDHDKGTLNASGTFELTDSKTDIKITAREMNFIKGEIASGLLDGDLIFQGSVSKGYDLKGTITAQKIDITIPEHFTSSVPQLNVQVEGQIENTTLPIAQSVKLDVRINAPRRVIVRGRGLDAEFGGSLDVKGTADKPLYYGALEVIRGRYSEFGKLFKFSKANINFSGSVPPGPELDIEARTKSGDITAIVAITGSTISPKISFSSEPAMPEDEVISHILFGEGMESLSPFQAVRLAQTLGRFTGQGGGVNSFDPIGSLRNFTGLDDLRFETDAQGSASVGAGKYLTDKVYLEFESGTENGSGNANVQIELTPNITLESEIGQDASGGAGFFWKWDY